MKETIGERLVIASHNAGKVAEIGALLAPFGIAVTDAGRLGLPEPAETETTFAGNARIKAHAAAQGSGLPALSDDSGIEVAGLDGAPGVYTADWAETGVGRDFVRAMTRVTRLLESRLVPHPRRARFVCTLCLAFPDGRDRLWRGEVRGRLAWPMRGERGHGFDPIFVPEGHDLTFGEMDPALKNRISHRAEAFARLLADLSEGRP